MTVVVFFCFECVVFSFKMSKYSVGMQLMGVTMAKSLATLALLMVYLFIALIVFSSMIYFAEAGDPVQTDSGVIYVRPGESNPRLVFRSFYISSC
jgi:hypothetical protein